MCAWVEAHHVFSISQFCLYLKADLVEIRIDFFFKFQHMHTNEEIIDSNWCSFVDPSLKCENLKWIKYLKRWKGSLNWFRIHVDELVSFVIQTL